MPDLGPPKTRRCHFFDSEGNPISRGGEYGCPRNRNTCHFIHPSDQEWTTGPAGSSLLSRIDNWRSPGGKSPPPRSPASSSTSFHGHERRPSFSIDRHAAPADSSSKRRRSPPLWSSTHHSDRDPVLVPRSPRRGTSPPRDRRGSSSTTTRDSRPLPHRASSNDRSYSYPQPDLPPPKSNSKPPPSKMGSDDRAHGKETKTVSASGSLKSPALPAASATFKAPSETTSNTPPALANVSSGSFSDVLPPPPSLPTKDGMTPAERRAVWEKRVALMADATQEYMDLGKLEKDVESRRRQVQSPAFSTLPSVIRDAFQANLANATATCEKKKASLNKALNKLSETDFWPSIPAQNVGDMEVKLTEAKTMLGGLADSVSQLYKRIESLYERRTGRSSAGPSGGATVASAGGDGDTTHSKKRRRLSVDGSDAVADMSSPDMREDVESIRDTIREIEDRLQEMENDMTQHSRNVMEQIEAKIDEKIEDIARNTDIAALVDDHKLGSQTAETIQTFQESIAQTDREIAELAQEVGDLIPQLDALQRENDLSKQEEAAEKELLEKLVKADQDNAEAIARLQEEAKTLRSALTAHAKRALPAAPAIPLSAPFMEAIKGSIITQVHEHILPVVAQTRSEMEHVAKARDTELYERLKDKLDQSLKMSELISTWIESNPEDARQALAAATARAEAGGAGSSDSVVA